MNSTDLKTLEKAIEVLNKDKNNIKFFQALMIKNLLEKNFKNVTPHSLKEHKQTVKPRIKKGYTVALKSSRLLH